MNRPEGETLSALANKTQYVLVQGAPVLAIPVQLQRPFLTAVKNADVGSFADTCHKTALVAVLRTLRIYLFLAEPKTICITAEVTSFMKHSL